VGFGANMPDSLKRTLDWAAFYGGTDNPLVANMGDTQAIIASSDPCNEGNSNDPADVPLAGYAFLASNADELATSLKTAIGIIREATYSFAVPAVASIREADENNIYQASFEPQNNEPFWPGHLIKYSINSDGSLGSALWDAADVLASTTAANRQIYTYKSGAVLGFTTTNLTCIDLGLRTSGTCTTAQNTRRNQIVGYVRGDTSYNPHTGKLGDIFRSNPEVIGTPLASFTDIIDANGAFASFRASHQRTSADNTRLIVVGSNDGQLHAFETGAGTERWSFIPPNLLPKLEKIAHATEPPDASHSTHQYYVDGPITHSDVWLGTGDGRAKSASDWKTYLVFGEGRGVESLSQYLWSSSASCNSGFNATYTSTYQYYCGYHALDVTDTSLTTPVYKWHINPSSAEAPYLGDPWGKVSIARVMVGGNEKWVGFVAAGYNSADCSGGGGCDRRGKGVFVIDMANGNVLKSWTRAAVSGMDYSLVATPAALDLDRDGFVDTVYIGDIGGNMWKFSLPCKMPDSAKCATDPLYCSTCDNDDWNGSLFFQAPSGVIRPVYTKAIAARDTDGNLWLYWGTGDKVNPTDPNAQERLYALKDGGGSYSVNDVENLASEGATYGGAKQGWYIQVSGQGEKILAEPAVFGGIVYFTTYTPHASGSDPCSQSGTPKLYGVGYTTGGGALYSGTQRSITLTGGGIASPVIVSLAPGGSPINVIVSVSGGGGVAGSIIVDPPGTEAHGLSNLRNIRYWKDKRLQ
ncbi:MAG: hypothetical protein HGA78_05960, partial [Nitrospirales bacterium]|nr:hypothetical protein [Nitrospirales bacterium]